MTRAFIDAVGARIATGVDALTSTTTVRARKSFVRETRFVDHAGEPIALALVASVPEDLIGRERFVPLAAPALAEVADTRPLPLFLALPAEADPLDPRGLRLLSSLAATASSIDVARSKVVSQGRAGGIAALELALAALATEEAVLVGGVDSWFDPDRLDALDVERRLHGPETENGFIPGEGAAFVRLSRRGAGERWGSVLSVATEREPRPYGSSEPSHALGISLAAARALASLGVAKIGWALTDVVGERHRVEEWLFASGRVQQRFTEDAVHETPLLLTGDLGAASALFLLVHACVSWRIGAAPSPKALIAAHSDGAERGAVLVGSEA